MPRFSLVVDMYERTTIEFYADDEDDAHKLRDLLASGDITRINLQELKELVVEGSEHFGTAIKEVISQ